MYAISGPLLGISGNEKSTAHTIIATDLICKQIVRYFMHVTLCILLAGDVTTNPRPVFSLSKHRTVKCLALNAKGLISVHGINNCEGNCSSLERFQNFVYTDETWLRDDLTTLKSYPQATRYSGKIGNLGAAKNCWP